MNHYRVAAVFLAGFGCGAEVWCSWLLGTAIVLLAALLFLVEDR